MARARALGVQAATAIAGFVALYAVLFVLKVTGVSDVNFDRQQIANGIVLGAICGSVALALVLIYRSTDVTYFAQGETAMFCTFISWSLIVVVGLNFWLALVVTLAIAALLGTTMRRIVIHPIRNAPLLTLVIVTLSLIQVFHSGANFIGQSQPKGFPTPFGRGTFHIFGAAIAKPYVGVIAVMLVILALVYCFFNYTKLGLASRAAAQNPLASRLCGVPVSWMLTIGWALAAAVGVAAGMLAASTLSLDPNMMVSVLLYAFAGAVLGGLNNPAGAVIGGFLVGITQNVVVGADLPKTIPDAVAFLVTMLVLIIRPTGLLGTRRVTKV